ncbi:hypothetical protein Fot_21448 [Forsythia ovata]|uniref:Uncharacterized protein n=1 Tax=Forsythia ovata TaxID=205694 RepID=A0ABD1UV62_9LAMI
MNGAANNVDFRAKDAEEISNWLAGQIGRNERKKDKFFIFGFLEIPVEGGVDAEVEESIRSSYVDSSKSKRALSSLTPSNQKAKIKAPDADPNPFIVKTYGKPANQPRRLHNRNAMLSIKEIRQAANNL